MNQIYTQDVDIIFVAIGCSLKWYDNVTHVNNQQCPPFITCLQGNRLHVLVDPELEAELRWTPSSNTIVIVDKEPFDYVRYSEIELLVHHCLLNNIRLVWQDYTGRDIRDIYLLLLQTFGRGILGTIIFDVTHDQGCMPDLTVNIPHKSGVFYQPLYEQFDPVYHDVFNARINFISYQLLHMYKHFDAGHDLTSLRVVYQSHMPPVDENSIAELIGICFRDIARVRNEDYDTCILWHYEHNLKDNYSECLKYLTGLKFLI